MTSSKKPSNLVDAASALVEAAKKAGADAADAIVVSGQSLGIDVRQGKVEETNRSENDGFALRVFVGKKQASISANDASAVDELAARAVSMAKVAPEDAFACLADQALLATDFLDLELFDETEVTTENLTDLAREVEEEALCVNGVKNTSGATAAWGAGGLVLVTSHGFCGSYSSSSFSISVSAVAGEGTAMERDYDYDSKRFFSDLKSPSQIGRMAGEKAVRRLNPQKVKSQTIPVLYDPRVSSSLLGHVSSAINGASIARQTSFLKDEMNKDVLNKAVTIIDDPLRKRGLASKPFDGEGVAVEKLTMVEDGVLKNWFLDSATAKELGLKTNGRAVRAGANPAPGRTNLTMLSGEKSPQDLIKEIGTGLYVTDLIGSGVSIVTGDYSRGASGFWIENGEIAYPVSEITIAGNLKDIFQSMIPANDLEYRFSTNAPTILIENMALAGR